MIDDGKNDPEYIKIEDRPWSLSHFEKWEHELRAQPKPDARTRRQRLTARFWYFIEKLGNSLDPTINTGGFYE